MTADGNGAQEATRRLLLEAFPPEWREPPLGWVAVQTWETSHGVVLPEPYRMFIAEIADGSSLGPPEDDGLLPLNWLPADWSSKERDVAADFPLVEAWFWEDDPREAKELKQLVDAVYRNGSLVLGSNSGPLYWLLVVSGPQRGRIWMLSDGGAMPFPGPAATEQDGVGFLDWVARWHEAPDTWDAPM
jgi:hypothetical protein